MNQLNPELKRLVRWAQQAPPVPPQEAPWGFSQQIVKQWCRVPVWDSFGMWQRAVSRLLWPAMGVVLLGLSFLMIQRFTSDSSYDLSPAYQVVSMELVP